MANDAYLRIKGVTEEPSDDKHRDQILLQNCAAGKTIPSATFERILADGHGKWNCFRQSVRGGTNCPSMEPFKP